MMPLKPNESTTSYWIAKRCVHWSASRNKRFRIVRLYKEPDVAASAGAVWDAKLLVWNEFSVMSDKGNLTLQRAATEKEISETIRC